MIKSPSSESRRVWHSVVSQSCKIDCCLLGEVSHLTALATSWPTDSYCWPLATLCKKRDLNILPGHMPVHARAWLRHWSGLAKVCYKDRWMHSSRVIWRALAPIARARRNRPGDFNTGNASPACGYPYRSVHPSLLSPPRLFFVSSTPLE